MARVLIVDDHKETCAILVKLFNRHGHIAESTTNGQAALEFMRRSAPHFVILDYMMPDMNGLDVLREIRKLPNVGAVPVVIYTANWTPQLENEARRCGASDVWHKLKIQMEPMIERMQALLEATPCSG